MNPHTRLPHAKEQTLSRGKQRRSESGAMEILVLRKLNAKPSSPSVVRVTQLLEGLIKAEELRCEIFEQDPAAEKYNFATQRFSADPLLQGKNQAFQSALKDIREMLSRYRWTPQVWPTYFYGLDVTFTAVARSEDDEWENR